MIEYRSRLIWLARGEIIVDERAYRGGNHPPYCTCHVCAERRAAKATESRGPAGWLSKLLRALKLKR